MLPRKFLDIRCSQIASEAILEQKQSRSSYIARGVLHLLFWLSMYAFAKPADFEFLRAKVLYKVGRTAGAWVDITRRTTRKRLK